MKKGQSKIKKAKFVNASKCPLIERVTMNYTMKKTTKAGKTYSKCLALLFLKVASPINTISMPIVIVQVLAFTFWP